MSGWLKTDNRGVCHGCKVERPCDRNACEKWRIHEAKKEKRYAEAKAQGGIDDYFHAQAVERRGGAGGVDTGKLF